MENKNPKLKKVVSVTGEYSYRNYTVYDIINLKGKLQLTKTLPDDANVEILDTHHKLKKDTPSGTSLSLGEEVKSGKKNGKNIS